MDKIGVVLKGTVQHIGDVKTITRLDKSVLRKKVLTIETPDNQVLFTELRNNSLSSLKKENIVIGSQVKIEIIFQGSIKDSKRYNNIYIKKITKI